MPLHLEVVCTDSRFLEQNRRERVVRVIGEILPFVLAKYCGEQEPAPHTEGSGVPEDCVPEDCVPEDFLWRFRRA